MDYLIHGNPDYSLSNENNPYDKTDTSSSRGEPYITDLAGRSTMVSDNMVMTKRLKAFVPRSSVKQGDMPSAWGEGASPEEDNISDNYKPKFQ
jgi:hypothetical protein